MFSSVCVLFFFCFFSFHPTGMWRMSVTALSHTHPLRNMISGYWLSLPSLTSPEGQPWVRMPRYYRDGLKPLFDGWKMEIVENPKENTAEGIKPTPEPGKQTGSDKRTGDLSFAEVTTADSRGIKRSRADGRLQCRKKLKNDTFM